MRVIAGSLKGRRLDAPTWEGLRPTSDKLRETLFNVLAPRFADRTGARVLDGYAGTGAVGIEAISRGAGHVTFVEHDRRAVALIESNLKKCGISDGYAIIQASVLQAIDRLKGQGNDAAFDVILLDPPYASDFHDALPHVGDIVKPDGVVILEHASKTDAPAAAGRLIRVRELKSGDSALTFYSCQP